MTRLTVVTPTLNQGSYIESTLVSVLRELGPDDTYVVVDGGSNDDTHAILDRYADRLSAIYVKPGLSQAQALEFGFEQWPGTFAAYLNSDDVWLTGAVAQAIACLERDPHLSCVYSDRVFIDENNTVNGVWKLPRHSPYLMKRWDYIPQETCFWRYQTMMLAGGIDPTLRFAVDYDLFVRLMNSAPAQHIEGFFAAFRVHTRSKTSTENESVGKPEVAQLKTRHRIHMYPWDRLVGRLVRARVGCLSRRYLRRHGTATLQRLVYEACDSYGEYPPSSSTGLAPD